MNGELYTTLRNMATTLYLKSLIYGIYHGIGDYKTVSKHFLIFYVHWKTPSYLYTHLWKTSVHCCDGKSFKVFHIFLENYKADVEMYTFKIMDHFQRLFSNQCESYIIAQKFTQCNVFLISVLHNKAHQTNS